MPFFVPGDPDLQTRPREGPSTSSVWIWHKSVRWFPRCFIHKKKLTVRRQKQNLPQSTARGNYIYIQKSVLYKTCTDTMHNMSITSSTLQTRDITGSKFWPLTRTDLEACDPVSDANQLDFWTLQKSNTSPWVYQRQIRSVRTDQPNKPPQI